MTGSKDRDVDRREAIPGRAQEPRGPAGSAGERLHITKISDEDYRGVWRPCHALEEDEGSDPG